MWSDGAFLGGPRRLLDSIIKARLTRTKSCSPSVACLLSSRGTEEMSLTAAQRRTARALLKWSQDKLAEASKVGAATDGDFEREARTPHHHILADSRCASCGEERRWKGNEGGQFQVSKLLHRNGWDVHLVFV